MSQREFARKMEGEGFKKQRSLLQWLHIDATLFLLLLLLCSIGLVVLYSASVRNLEMLQTQAFYMGLGFIAMFIAARIPVLYYRRMAPYFYVLGIILLLMVLLLGDHSKGAKRWLEIPGLPRFQPSEIIKVVMPLVVAWYLSKRILPPKLKYIIAVLLIVAVPAGLIAKQPDLGTAILVASSGLFVLLFAGVLWRFVFSAVAILALAAWPIWHYVLHGYQRQRILTMINPESDKLGAGWNLFQSKTAIGSGGWQGVGWLEGTQSQLKFLPESHTDFILAVLSEEWGFVGFCLLMTVYFCIILRMLILAWSANILFSKLVIASVAMTFFVYVFVNVGMVSGMLPVVGVPLPFISRGGTSIVSLLLGFGIVMAMATDKHQFLRN